jgi:hypothetical protein
MQQYEHKWFVENSIRMKFDLTLENWFNNRLLSFSFLWLNLNPILIALENKEDYLFGPVFNQISNFFFIKIECGLYFLNRFDVLI